jgi:hypothetical protein
MAAQMRGCKEDNMSESNSFGHGEFIERIAAYLSGGLEGAERSAFEDHRDACAACAAELKRAQEADAMLTGIFADAQPSGGFEDRIVKELRTTWRPMSLPSLPKMPNPMVLKVASGVAAAILLGAVGFVGNSLIQNNKLPGAARMARHDSSAPVTNQEYAWAYDFDGEKTWSEKDAKQSDANGRFDGFAKERGRAGEPQQEAQLKRGESEELRSKSEMDGTKALGEVVNGEVDAIRDKNGGAIEGKPKSNPSAGVSSFGGITGAGGFGNAVVQFGEKFDDHIAVESFGVQVANGATSLGMESAAGGAGKTGSGTLTLTQPAGQSIDNYFDTRAGRRGTAPVSITHFEDSDGKDSRGDAAAAAGKSLAALGVNRYYQPMTLSGAISLGDAIDKEDSKKLGKGLTLGSEARDVDEKAKAGDVPAKLAERPAQPPTNRETAVAQSDSTGVADPQQGQEPPRNSQTQTNVPQTSAQQQPMVAQRKIIRNGEMEFEVDSFDTSFLQISKIVGEEGGFVSSTDSEKLPNGKVRGTVVVRVPPEHLDTLVLKLRALGDLKSQKISAQDVTKVYYDLESELKAARAMEERLLNIIKGGKGEIKDLLAAEKELGVYRSKIEKFEGEIRYYNNLVSFSTLSITSVERDIRKAAFASQTEQVNMGIESEDVEKARADALKAIDDAKGRVIESNLKKFDAGQLAATITAEVAPDASGPLIDRLRQLGRMARLDIERKQTTSDGAPVAAPQGLRVEKKDTRFSISMYNLANIAPRQTTNMNVAVPSVEDAYRAIIETVRTKNGRVVTSSLNRQKPEQTTATISFEVPAADADATLAEIRRDREVMMLTVTENPDTNNVTAAKRGFSLQVFSMATVAPRETETMIVASRIRVADAFRNLLNELRKADARILQSQLSEQEKNNVGGILDFEISRTKELDVRQALGAAGDLVSRAVNRSSDTDQTVDSKIRLQVRMISFDRLVPRESQSIEVASRDVAGAYRSLASAVNEVNGRVIRSELNVQEKNNVSGIIEFELRREDRDKFQKALEAAGTLFSRAVNRAADNVNTVDSKIRMQVHLTHVDQLPARERTKMVVEVAEVDRATTSLIGTITAAGGRIIDTEQSKDNSGQIRSHIVADVPLSKAGEVRGQIRALGTDRINESSTNHQAPEGEVARAQFDVTLANADLIVGRDEGLGAAVKSALSTSVRGLLWSLQFIVIGLLMVLPWVLMIWGGWKLWKRSKTAPVTA